MTDWHFLVVYLDHGSGSQRMNWKAEAQKHFHVDSSPDSSLVSVFDFGTYYSLNGPIPKKKGILISVMKIRVVLIVLNITEISYQVSVVWLLICYIIYFHCRTISLWVILPFLFSSCACFCCRTRSHWVILGFFSAVLPSRNHQLVSQIHEFLSL